MSEYRLERMGHLIQERIGALIVAGKIKDPRVDSFISVTRVSVSRDLSFADVYVSSFQADEQLKRGIDGLQSAAGFIQAQLDLHSRQTPKLRFHEDEGLRQSFELVKKIEGLTSEDGR